MSGAVPGDFEDVYSRWAAGRCPCCGGNFYDWEEPPVAIGQGAGYGVWLCGWCVGRDHHRSPDDFVGMMPAAIAQGLADADGLVAVPTLLGPADSG